MGTRDKSHPALLGSEATPGFRKPPRDRPPELRRGPGVEGSNPHYHPDPSFPRPSSDSESHKVPRPILRQGGQSPTSSCGPPSPSMCTPSVMNRLQSCFTGTIDPQSAYHGQTRQSSSQGHSPVKKMGRQRTKRGMSGPGDELNIKDTQEQKEGEGDHVRFSGIDEVLNNAQEREESDTSSSGLEDPNVDTSLEVYPYEAERTSIVKRLLGKAFNICLDPQLFQLTVYLAITYEALERRQPVHLSDKCPSSVTPSIDELRQCCWREKEARMMERNLSPTSLRVDFQREVTAAIYDYQARKPEKIGKGTHKWPFHAKKLFRKWISEHAGETWDTPSIHACEVMSNETGVPPGRIRSHLKYWRLKLKHKAQKQGIIPKVPGRACIVKEINSDQKMIIRGWLSRHSEYPFPDDTQMADLVTRTGLYPELIWKVIEFIINYSRKTTVGDYKIPETNERRFLWAMPGKQTPASKRLKQGPSAEEQNVTMAQTMLANKPHIERMQKEIEETRKKRREQEAQRQNTAADNQPELDSEEELEQEFQEEEVQNLYTDLRASSRDAAESSRGS